MKSLKVSQMNMNRGRMFISIMRNHGVKGKRVNSDSSIGFWRMKLCNDFDTFFEGSFFHFGGFCGMFGMNKYNKFLKKDVVSPLIVFILW